MFEKPLDFSINCLDSDQQSMIACAKKPHYFIDIIFNYQLLMKYLWSHKQV